MTMMKKFLKWLFIFFLILLSGFCIHYVTTARDPLSKVSAQIASVQDGQIEYYQFGQGTPIILISGYAMDVTGWSDTFLSTLAQHHQVIVPNNRNVGNSVIHSSHYQTQDLANDIYQLIQYLHLHKPAIAGISMGGMIAQQIAVSYPDKIGQLILINTAIAGDKVVHPSDEIEKQIMNLPTNDLKRFWVAIHLFFPPGWQWKMAYEIIKDHFQPAQYTKTDFAKVMPAQRQLIQAWLKDNAAAAKLKHIQVPVLIINGEADTVIPPINSEILARTFPHAKLVRWKEGGHAIVFQYPKEIAENINTFME